MPASLSRLSNGQVLKIKIYAKPASLHLPDFMNTLSGGAMIRSDYFLMKCSITKGISTDSSTSPDGFPRSYHGA